MREAFYCEDCALQWRDSYVLLYLYQSSCPRCGELCDALVDTAEEYVDSFDDAPGNLTDSRDLSALESDKEIDAEADADEDADADSNNDGDAAGGGDK
jgi:hypothetical protein